MISYPQWLEGRIARRISEYPILDPSVSFSVLTTVYEGSEANFLTEAGHSILNQSYPAFEWIVLAHGPVTSQVEDVLNGIGSHPRCNVLRLESNLGIIGGMQHCLSVAAGDYLIPVDADDILGADALQVMAHFVSRLNRPALVYSDEDHWVNGVPSLPYLRPSWDPVLALSSSYIWHLTAIARPLALELGVYTDAGANWCHDWDTVLRFAAAGKRIAHVPEVLYHWRQHAASNTNRPDPNFGSLRSQRHVLERWVKSHPTPELFSVEEFPIHRGAIEYWIARRPVCPPSLVLIAYGHTKPLLLEAVYSALRHGIGSVSEVHLVGIEGLGAGERTRIADLAGGGSTRIQVWPEGTPSDIAMALQESTAAAIAVMSDDVTVDPGWVWEADRLLRLHPEVALVAARILDRQRVTLSGGEVFGFNGISGSPDAGRSENDAGHFAIALKPRCVSAPHPWFFVARRSAFLEGLRGVPAETAWSTLGIWLGGLSAERGELVAYSPLINAVRQTSRPVSRLFSSAESRLFARRFIRFIPDFRRYSKWYSWSPGASYSVQTMRG
jgi:glycosyltransferase involved in cell wall biosynthesis